MFYQVKYKVNGDKESSGGIAEYYKNNSLIQVIDGHSGAVFYPDEVRILERDEIWSDISDNIVASKPTIN